MCLAIESVLFRRENSLDAWYQALERDPELSMLHEGLVGQIGTKYLEKARISPRFLWESGIRHGGYAPPVSSQAAFYAGFCNFGGVPEAHGVLDSHRSSYPAPSEADHGRNQEAPKSLTRNKFS
jgi:hypothetical protein